MICCHGNIVAYLLPWRSTHFITFATIISIIMWVARKYFKRHQIAPKLMAVRSNWQHLSKTSPRPETKGSRLVKRCCTHWEKSMRLLFRRPSSFVHLPPSTTYWPRPLCNVCCLRCHNSSWLSPEYVSIACWCVLRWGKVSERGRGRGVAGEGGERQRRG